MILKHMPSLMKFGLKLRQCGGIECVDRKHKLEIVRVLGFTVGYLSIDPENYK